MFESETKCESHSHIFMSFWNQICNSTDYIYFNDLQVYPTTNRWHHKWLIYSLICIKNTVLTWKNVSHIPVKILYGTFPSDVQPLLWLVPSGFICGITVSCFTTGTFEMCWFFDWVLIGDIFAADIWQRNKEKNGIYTCLTCIFHYVNETLCTDSIIYLMQMPYHLLKYKALKHVPYLYCGWTRVNCCFL